MPTRIEIIEADITTLEIDAYVISATPSLAPCSKVDQHVHAIAGPNLMLECGHVSPCPVGEARITRGYNLPTSFVVHAVAPKWGGGEANEDDLLKNCYSHALGLVRSFDVGNIAFSSLTTSEHGFPQDRAAHLAMTEILHQLSLDKNLQRIIFCCEDEIIAQSYEAAFDKCAA